MTLPIRTIAFDADDTLWHNENLFRETQEAFRDLLRSYHDDAWINARMEAAERRNLRHFGYGVKGFVLSLVETAVELTEGRIPGSEVQKIIDLGKGMLQSPVDPLPGVAPVLEALAPAYELMVITKGDLFDQESKLARSGLGHHFARVEILSEKDQEAYAAVLRRHAINPERFLMVGNSVKSDVLPVVALGGRAIHIPYEVTWEHEQVPDADPVRHGYVRLDSIAELPEWLDSVTG